MLHAVTELGEHRFRHVERILRDEIDADTLGTDEAHDLLDALQQHLRRVVEEKMRLVEEEHQLRLFRIADFRQHFEQLGEHPEQEGAIEARVHHQLVGGEHRDRAAAVIGGAHDVGNLQRRFAEEVFGTLLLEDQQFALDRADGGLGNEAELVGQRRGVLAHIVEQRLEILEIEQRQAALIGDLEGDVDDAFLRIRGVHQAREQQRAHLGHGGADAVALLAVEIPEDDGEFLEIVGRQADLVGALLEKVLRLAHGADARKVALHVGAEHRHAGIRKALGEDLQRHRLAGAGRAGHEAVAVAEFQVQIFRLVVGVVRLAAGADIKLAVLKNGIRHAENSLTAGSSSDSRKRGLPRANGFH